MTDSGHPLVPLLLQESLPIVLVPSSTNPHCRFPACQARQSHITSRVTRNYAYGCQISRRETHVTSIKFILTAILLVNLSFVPWFCSDWTIARMSSVSRPIADPVRSIIVRRYACTMSGNGSRYAYVHFDQWQRRHMGY